jgi:hypothetical protein
VILDVRISIAVSAIFRLDIAAYKALRALRGCWRYCGSKGLFYRLSGAKNQRSWQVSGKAEAMARLKWRKRMFKSLTEGFKQGFRPRSGREVSAKEVTRPVAAAMEGEGAALVDSKLRSGAMDPSLREEWGLDDGKRSGV